MRLLQLLLFPLVFGVAIAGPLRAQDWPQRPVRILVPYPPGGNSDGQARIVAQRFTEVFRQPFVIENRTGAGGALAVEGAVHAPADGYTLLWGVQPQIVILPAINKVSYDAVKDLVPISVLGSNSFALVINGKIPAKTVPEFVDYLRANRTTMNYGTNGVGSVAHLAMALFLEKVGVKLPPVHYRGNAQAMTDIVAGHIPAMFATLPDALPQATKSEVRLLAVTGDKRAGQLPQVPTIAESGYPNYRIITWNGLMAPAGTPQPIVDRLATEMARAVEDTAFAARVTAFGVDPLGNSPAEFSRLIATEIPLWKQAVTIAEVKSP